MSEKLEPTVSRRRYVNSVDKDTLKPTSGESADRICGCFVGQRFLLFLYRIMCFVFCYLFWGVFWQWLGIFDKVKPFGACPSKQTASKTAAKGDEESYKMKLEASWILVEKQDQNNNTDLNLSDDNLHENYEDGDGFQDDDYHDILRCSTKVDSFEQLLEPCVIDWEAPMRLEEEQGSEPSHSSSIEMFIEDNYVTISKIETSTDTDNGNVSLDDSGFPKKECLSNRDFWTPPLENVLQNEEHASPIDDDVLAAITGVQLRN